MVLHLSHTSQQWHHSSDILNHSGPVNAHSDFFRVFCWPRWPPDGSLCSESKTSFVIVCRTILVIGQQCHCEGTPTGVREDYYPLQGSSPIVPTGCTELARGNHYTLEIRLCFCIVQSDIVVISGSAFVQSVIDCSLDQLVVYYPLPPVCHDFCATSQELLIMM